MVLRICLGFILAPGKDGEGLNLDASFCMKQTTVFCLTSVLCEQLFLKNSIPSFANSGDLDYLASGLVKPVDQES